MTWLVCATCSAPMAVCPHCARRGGWPYYCATGCAPRLVPLQPSSHAYADAELGGPDLPERGGLCAVHSARWVAARTTTTVTGQRRRVGAFRRAALASSAILAWSASASAQTPVPTPKDCTDLRTIAWAQPTADLPNVEWWQLVIDGVPQPIWPLAEATPITNPTPDPGWQAYERPLTAWPILPFWLVACNSDSGCSDPSNAAICVTPTPTATPTPTLTPTPSPTETPSPVPTRTKRPKPKPSKWLHWLWRW